MRSYSMMLLLTVAASLLAAPAAHAQETASAFTWFQKICMDTGGQPDRAASLAAGLGWKKVSEDSTFFGGQSTTFQSNGDGRTSLVLTPVPAGTLVPDAFAQLCIVGEAGSDQNELDTFLTEWTGFTPEEGGGFKFWAYTTVNGIRTPERGLMKGLSGEELLQRVRDGHVVIIGVMHGITGPSFAYLKPFL